MDTGTEILIELGHMSMSEGEKMYRFTSEFTHLCYKYGFKVSTYARNAKNEFVVRVCEDKGNKATDLKEMMEANLLYGALSCMEKERDAKDEST